MENVSPKRLRIDLVIEGAEGEIELPERPHSIKVIREETVETEFREIEPREEKEFLSERPYVGAEPIPGPKYQTERCIRAAYELITDYERKYEDESDPKEKRRIERSIREQIVLIERNLAVYYPLCERLATSQPDDIVEIAAWIEAYRRRLSSR